MWNLETTQEQGASTHAINTPSPFVMQICYNTHVFHESGEPYRSGTGEDRLPCPPRDRRQLCMTANTAFIGNTGHISCGNERHGCELCTPLGCLARFSAFVSGQTRASGECMGKGKCAPSSCVRHGAGRCWHGAQQQEKSEMNDLDVGSRGGVNAAIVENQE